MVWNLIPVGKVTAGFPSPAVAVPPNESALPAKSTVVDRAPSEYHPVLSLGSSASSMAARLESKAFSRLMYSTCAAAEMKSMCSSVLFRILLAISPATLPRSPPTEGLFAVNVAEFSLPANVFGMGHGRNPRAVRFLVALDTKVIGCHRICVLLQW